jgi:predicted dehydrogenase
MVRSALLGCGPRARGHARAYRPIERGEIVAICDRDETLLGSFGDEVGIDRRYTDLGQMLERGSCLCDT